MAIGETTEERNARIRPYISTAREKLADRNVPFIEKNGGLHFVVDSLYDYWPTTGKFTNRSTKKSGRGIFNLLKKFNKKPSVK